MKKIFFIAIFLFAFFVIKSLAWAEIETQTFGMYSFGYDKDENIIFLSIKGATQRSMEHPDTYNELLLITNAVEYKVQNDVVFMTLGEKIADKNVKIKILIGQDDQKVFDVTATNVGYEDDRTQLYLENKNAVNIFKLILDNQAKIILNNKTYYFFVDVENGNKMEKFLTDFKKDFNGAKDKQ